MTGVPALRVRAVNDAAMAPARDYVLYWPIAQRRPFWNFGLQRAVEHARALDRPLLVLDALGAGHRWACDRTHAFVLGGISDDAQAYAQRGVQHLAYVEPEAGAGKGLLEELSARACVVVTDEFPCFHLPHLVRAAGRRVGVRMEAVDSNGLLPLRAADKVFPSAHAFRRFLQRELPLHLGQAPAPDPLDGVRLPEPCGLPARTMRDWPRARAALLAARPAELARLPIDHAVGPVATAGGHVAGARVLQGFLDRKLVDYDEERNEPEADATSGLSPYLHFGMVAIHQIFAELARREDWTPARLASKPSGSRSGWWGMGTTAEAFLDQAVTWRKLGYNFCALRPDYERYESLPPWALRTLEDHASDPRPQVYDLATLEAARTHDPLWNAAQNELVTTGRMHNYLRMLWGKKVLEWSAHPREALHALIELNNKYALDGRDPNSYSGIFWCLGRFDRPWGPERPIFGKVRYMSSANTARKHSVEAYLERFGSGG